MQVRHGERVNMRSAGGDKWYTDPEFMFPPLQLKTRTISCEDTPCSCPTTSLTVPSLQEMDWNVPLSEKASHGSGLATSLFQYNTVATTTQLIPPGSIGRRTGR
jgi:hypothetical protein